MEIHNALVHEGKKPFKCSFCNAKFSRLGSLDGHVTRFHEKKKTFNCSKSDETKKIVKKSKQKLSKSEKSARIKNIEDQIAHLRRDFDESKESENDYDNDFDHSLMVNPWQVESMDEFACLKCPECVFTTKEENIFQDHAVENHPLSHVLYGIPMQATPTQVIPLQATPTQATPNQVMPLQASPTQATPTQATPTQAIPSQAMLNQGTGNKQYPCTRCNHAFGKEISLLEHLHSVHFKTKNYFCHICTEIPQGFSVWNNFKKHLLLSHNMIDDKQTDQVKIIEESEKRTPKTDSDANIVVHNYYPNDIVKDYSKENVNVLQYSPSNEVSMITEEISEKTYCVELSLETELELNHHVRNLDEEFIFEEKNPFTPKNVSEMEIHTIGKETQNCIEDYHNEKFSTPSNFLKDLTGNFENTAECNANQTLFDKQGFKESEDIVILENCSDINQDTTNFSLKTVHKGSINAEDTSQCSNFDKVDNEFCIEASKFVKDMMCLICDLEFDTLVALINHIKKEHEIMDKVEVIKEKPSDIDQNCFEDYPQENFVPHSNLPKDATRKLANTVESNENRFECRFCKYRSKKRDNLKKHMKYECKKIKRIIYLKMDDWQLDKMTEELRDGFESWRMIADISPSNTALMKEARFEEFRKWSNNLKPPEGKNLTQFATLQVVRKRIYNWIMKCKNRQKQIRASKIPLAKWQGSWKILYDLIILNKLPDGSAYNPALNKSERTKQMEQ